MRRTVSNVVTRATCIVLLASIGCAGAGDNGAPWNENGLHGCDSPDGGSPDDPTPMCSSAEVCDGVDDENCDGTVDENCGRCPLMTIACPTGCCSVDSWAVSTEKSDGAEIAVDDAGNVFFAYTKVSPDLAVLAIYDAVPGTWREVPLGAGTYRNRIRIGAMGRVHVLTAGGSEYKLSYRRSDDHGLTFTTPITLGTLDIGGTFDMELDSAGQPHVVYGAPYLYSGAMRYTHLVGTMWKNEALDLQDYSKDYIDLELGFADRPHVVFEGYNAPGVTGHAKRYMFFNGNRWITENIDLAGQTQYLGDHYFTAHTLRVAADDSREVLFTRTSGTTETLELARRGPLDSDTWQITPITGVTGVNTPTMFIDHHGKRGAVSNGVGLHREQAGTAWTTTSLGVPGGNVAVARRGHHLYLGYRTGTSSVSGPPTINVIDLGP